MDDREEQPQMKKDRYEEKEATRKDEKVTVRERRLRNPRVNT